MAILEYFRLFALMISPLLLSLIVGGVWEKIEWKREEK